MKGFLKSICARVVLTVAFAAFSYAGETGKGGIVRAGDAFLEQLQKRDSVLIADQMRYGFRLSGVQTGTEIDLPDLGQALGDSVEIIDDWTLDTLKLRNRRTELDLEGSIVVTSFDEGVYSLPDIAVRRVTPDGRADTLVFAGKTLEVRSMPVDTVTYKPHDIKGQMRYPLTFREVLPYLFAIQFVALIAILAAAIVMDRRKKKTGIGQSTEPPYIVALKKLDHYRGNKLWAPEKQKQFYSGITDVLREYIAARFGIGAMEMTTAEIFGSLKDCKDIPQSVMDEARNLFVMSDLVKFAKMTVSDEDNVKAVPSAVRFVTTTWKSEAEDSDGGEVSDKDKKEA